MSLGECRLETRFWAWTALQCLGCRARILGLVVLGQVKEHDIYIYTNIHTSIPTYSASGSHL